MVLLPYLSLLLSVLSFLSYTISRCIWNKLVDKPARPQGHYLNWLICQTGKKERKKEKEIAAFYYL